MIVPEVVVIDYGAGNLLSVQRGFEHCGAKVTTTSNAAQILSAERIILPGVGAFADAMKALDRLGLISVIQEVAMGGAPFFGICLGMQLLLDESEEFESTPGLGLIAGKVKAIPETSKDNQPLKSPHVGWNELQVKDKTWKDTVLTDTKPEEAMYFLHSFFSEVDDRSHRLADCIYGGHELPAVIRKDNITGCQFHPEKSGEAGLNILRQFLRQ